MPEQPRSSPPPPAPVALHTSSAYPCARVLLGRVPYATAWELQRALVAARQEGRIPDVLLLLEHPPTYTIGRSGAEHDVLASPASLRSLGATVISVDRGGQTTYHGPGQLVGYPILDLRLRGCDVHRYLRGLEAALVDALADLGLAARRVDGKTGVWVGERKLASIGIRVQRWVTSHGFALNVTTDLSYFSHIVPCGLPEVAMTSLAQELRREGWLPSADEAAAASSAPPDGWKRGTWPVAPVQERVSAHLARVLGLTYLEQIPPALRELLETAVSPGQVTAAPLACL